MTENQSDRPDGNVDGGEAAAAAELAAQAEAALIGNIVIQDIDRELHDSYLTYAMSTIMDRALPDVRDGLKPSQRRILVAMHDLSLSPGRKHIKCAKICGDTSGNYHPHGEGVIYPTLVNLGQDWKTRYPLVDKQGNFGSIEGDPPAAMRYTEARMTAAAMAMLEDLKSDTVDFKPNYDDRLMEPTVLPAKLPNLLVNGSSGIAVGMASSIPPHNIGEICRAVAAVIDDPQITLDRLMEIVPGPDFPTGGIIVGRRGIVDAYANGRGRIVVRGCVHHEKQGNRDVIVIDRIPFQVNQTSLIEKIVEASRSDRITDISDVRNHSGRDARTRILVVLKKGADPNVVEKQLYEYTPLQDTFSVANIALVNRQPRTLGLRQLIQCHIDHRVDVIRRRTEFLLRQARQAAHRLEGLMLAVCDIDEVIKIIRGSRTRDEAIQGLQDRAFRIAVDHPLAPLVPQALRDRSLEAEAAGGLRLTRVQAEAIGALRLIQLTGLEIERLASEYSALLDRISEFERILSDHSVVLGMVRADVVELGETFGDARRTTIEEGDAEDYDLADLIPEHQVVITISHRGYAKRLPVDTYREQGRGGRGIRSGETRDEDFIEHIIVASSHDELLCFTNTGRVYRIRAFRIPEMSRAASGRALVNLLELRPDEKICAFLSVPDFEQSEEFLVFATSSGRIKRSSLADYRNVHRGGIIAVHLNDDDRLVGVIRTSGEDDVLLATAGGMAIRFAETDARPMGRNAAGVRGIDLRDDDEVVGLVRCGEGADPDLLTVTERGYGKRTDLAEYLVQSEDGSFRRQSRGGKGRIDIRTTGRNGRVAAVRSVSDRDGLMLVSERGMLVRIAVSSISRIGRATQGVRLVGLKEGDRLIGVATVAESDGDEIESDAIPALPEPVTTAGSDSTAPSGGADRPEASADGRPGTES